MGIRDLFKGRGGGRAKFCQHRAAGKFGPQNLGVPPLDPYLTTRRISPYYLYLFLSLNYDIFIHLSYEPWVRNPHQTSDNRHSHNTCEAGSIINRTICFCFLIALGTFLFSSLEPLLAERYVFNVTEIQFIHFATFLPKNLELFASTS